MTHLFPAEAAHAAPQPISRARLLQPALPGDGAPLQHAITAKRAYIAQLEAAWVAAAEAELARHLRHGIRIDERATWDRETWTRYLAAATAHEPNFQPRIMRLLREIESLGCLLASPAAPHRDTSELAEAGR